MTIIGQVLATALWLYWLLFIGRLIFDFVQIFARFFFFHSSSLQEAFAGCRSRIDAAETVKLFS